MSEVHNVEVVTQEEKAFPYRKVNVRSVEDTDLLQYSGYRTTLEKFGDIEDSRIRGTQDNPGVQTLSQLSTDSWYAALPMAISDLTQRGVLLGIADEAPSPEGVSKIVLADTKNGDCEIEILSHKDYREVRILNRNDSRTEYQFDEEAYRIPVLSLHIPNHMTDPVYVPQNGDHSNFYATRFVTPGRIDPGMREDPETVQEFASIVRDITGRIVSALPDEPLLKAELLLQGWKSDGEDPSSGGGGSGPNDPDGDNPNGGKEEDQREKMSVRELNRPFAANDAKSAEIPGDE